MATSPDSSRHLQVPHSPVRQPCGNGTPRSRAASRMVALPVSMGRGHWRMVSFGTGLSPWTTVSADGSAEDADGRNGERSEEHTSELQSLMRISYAVFCLKKKKHKKTRKYRTTETYRFQ